MKQHKQDRRSKRTYHLVNTAMMTLLLEKRYNAITVQDILDRADIGRSTFYTHYYDKEDVLVGVTEQMLDLFSQRMQQVEKGNGIVPGLELFQHAQQMHQHFQVLLRGQSGAVLMKTAQTLLSKNIEHSLTSAFAGKRSPSVPLEVVSHTISQSVVERMVASLVFIPSPNLFFNKLRPFLQHINRTAKCPWKLLPRRSADLALLSLRSALHHGLNVGSETDREKHAEWSEVCKHRCQLLHPSGNSLFVGSRIAKH